MSGSFTSTVEQRREEAERIMKKYPDRIPVFVEKRKGSTIPDIDKRKYLVPRDLTMGQFMYVIRKRIKLSADQAIFLFVNDTLRPAGELMSQTYKECAGTDNFLRIIYSGEAVFGSR